MGHLMKTYIFQLANSSIAQRKASIFCRHIANAFESFSLLGQHLQTMQEVDSNGAIPLLINLVYLIVWNVVLQPKVYPVIAVTALRNNQWYYRIYCMGLNCIIATVLPLVLLLYLNIYTVIGQLNISKQSVSLHAI